MAHAPIGTIFLDLLLVVSECDYKSRLNSYRYSPKHLLQRIFNLLLHKKTVSTVIASKTFAFCSIIVKMVRYIAVLNSDKYKNANYIFIGRHFSTKLHKLSHFCSFLPLHVSFHISITVNKLTWWLTNSLASAKYEIISSGSKQTTNVAYQN